MLTYDAVAMDVDGVKNAESGTKSSRGRVGKRKIEKRRKPKNSIVFWSLRNHHIKKKKKKT